MAQLGVRISQVEHVQEDGSRSVRATTSDTQATGNARRTRSGRVPQQLWAVVKAPAKTSRTEQSFGILWDKAQ